MNDIKSRTDLANYRPLIQSFVAALNAKLADCPVTGLSFEIDPTSSYPESSLRLSLRSDAFDKCTELLEIDLSVYSCKQPQTGHYLAVDYRSAEQKSWTARGGRRDIRVNGTVAEQVAKLVKRAVTRYHEAVESKAKADAAEAASEARKKQWYADFTGPDGKLVIPLDFAYAYNTPGEYHIDTSKSAALRSNRWRKEEVLKLTAVLAEVRAAMVADGRITLKPKSE